MSYLELLIKLIAYLKSDEAMPTETNAKARQLCTELFELLFPYSD